MSDTTSQSAADKLRWLIGNRPDDAEVTVHVADLRAVLAAASPVSLKNPGPWPYRELARQEWPHMPLSLAMSYADEYVRTGRKP